MLFIHVRDYDYDENSKDMSCKLKIIVFCRISRFEMNFYSPIELL
jgi:hypothetical protein